MNTTTQPQATPNGRDAKGHFTIGNGGGPGNPHARQVAELRKTLLQCVTPEAMQAIAAKLIELARAGNLQAIKLLFSYTLGKPAPAVDPDRVDLDEWALLKATATMAPEIPDVVTAPGARLPLLAARACQQAPSEHMGELLLQGIFAMDPDCAATIRQKRLPTEPANDAGTPSANGGDGPRNPATASARKENQSIEREAPSPRRSNGANRSVPPSPNGIFGPSPPAAAPVPTGAAQQEDVEDVADDQDPDRLLDLVGNLNLVRRCPAQ